MKTWRKHPLLNIAVSMDGRVAELGGNNARNLKYKRIHLLKQYRRSSRSSYMCICITINKKQKLFSVHRLVAETFLGLSGMPCVNHKDSNPENNHIDNLEWCTYKENNEHMRYNNKVLIEKVLKDGTESTKRRIINSHGYIYESISFASRYLRIPISTLWGVIKSGKVHNGIRWEYYSIG